MPHDKHDIVCVYASWQTWHSSCLCPMTYMTHDKILASWISLKKLGDDRKSASWQKYLWFSFLKQILSMQVPLWRNTAISSCIEFMDKKFHAHLWETHCKDLFLYEIIMREPLQRFLFIWNNFFLGFWSLHNFLGSYQWMDAGKRKWLSPET